MKAESMKKTKKTSAKDARTKRLKKPRTPDYVKYVQRYGVPIQVRLGERTEKLKRHCSKTGESYSAVLGELVDKYL